MIQGGDFLYDSYRGIAEQFHRFWMLRKIKIQSFTGDFSCRFGQFPLLGYVEQHEGCTQQQAAEAMSVSAPAVAVSVKRLQKAGFLKKEADPGNLRKSRLSLTDAGRETAQAFRRNFDELDTETFGCLSEEEARALSVLMKKLTDCLAAAMAGSPEMERALSLRPEITEEKDERAIHD